MNSKERIKAILNFEEPDKIGMHDTFWLETIKRWKKEGLPTDVPEPEEGGDYKWLGPNYFNMDFKFVEIDVSPRFERKVLEKEPNSDVIIDEWGCKRKRWIGKDGAPQVLEAFVKTKEDWENVEGRLTPDINRFVDPTYDKLKELRDSDKFIALFIFDPWEWGWRIRGFVELLRDFFKNPQFVREMYEALARFQIELIKIAVDEGVIDGLWMWGDAGYTSGPFVSPKKYEELITPIHKRFCDLAKKHDLPVIIHSDGDIRTLIPLLIKAGITCFQAIEADILDIGELKEEYGDKLVFMGGVDVRELSKGPDVAREEIIKKIKKAAYGGGFIYHSDHSVPPSVSFEAYKAALKAIERYGRYKP
jgi:uroporphyrinogen decarboxylase